MGRPALVAEPRQTWENRERGCAAAVDPTPGVLRCFGMVKSEMSPRTETQWWEYLDGTSPPPLALHSMRIARSLFARLPADPRCKFCAAPFAGVGGTLVRPLGKRPSTLTPYLCMSCELVAKRQGGGGETPAALVFADVRGSTSLAERLPPAEYSGLIDRFYRATTDVLTKADAFIEKLAGDEVTAVFVPGFAGSDYAAKAVTAARDLVEATGHHDPGGPWVPVGVGVHVGTVFVTVVGREGGSVDYAVLGDTPNVAARITSQAGTGEILVSEDAVAAADIEGSDLEQRTLELPGKSALVPVRVIV